MPQPYDYTTRPVDVGGFFDAIRQGRADRLATEEEGRQNALAKYLPGALRNEPGAREQALAVGTPDQQIALFSQFSQLDDASKAREFATLQKTAQVLYGVKKSANPQMALEQAKPMLVQFGAKPEDIEAIDLDDIDGILASATSLSDQIERDFKERQFGLQSRVADANIAQSYAAADASRARAAAGGGGRAPSGYIWNPDQTALIPIPGGPADLSTKPLNDEQSKALGFANRIRASSEIIGGTDATGALTDWGTQAAAGVPLVGNYLAGENYQQADQAARDFINAQLRRESGAAIGASEFENAFKQYLPQRGDGPKVLAQKKAAREMALQNMLLSAGGARRGAITAPPEPTVTRPAAPAAPQMPSAARPTATGPNGEKLILSEDGRRWVPVR